MKEFLNHFIWMFGGICLIAFIIEFPYSLVQGTEFSLTARSMGIYLVVSVIYGVYKMNTGSKAIDG